MQIEFRWHTDYEAQYASKLAARVSHEARVVLHSIDPHTRNWRMGVQGLCFEAKSLNDKIKVPRETWDQSYDVSAAIMVIERELGGLQPNVYIDGMSLTYYAAKQEKRAETYKARINEAVSMLRSTRRWFGSKVFGEIRRYLELTIDIADLS